MRLKYALGLVSCVALTTWAGAQTPPPTTQPPTAPQTQPTPAQPIPGTKNTPAPVNPYPPALYQVSDVAKSMNLNQDQLRRLNDVTGKVQGQYTTLYNKLGTLNDADQFIRIQELNRQYAADWNKSAADILNADQRLRYQQLTQQYGGFSTLYDPEVQKRLSLTPEQMRGLRANVDWSNRQFSTITTAGAVDASKGTPQYEAFRKQQQERFNKFLTPEQLKIWREMTGEPFAFPPPFPQR